MKLMNKFPYWLYTVVVLSGVYFFLVFLYGGFVDDAGAFSHPKFWIVLLAIWFLLALYVFVRGVFLLRAKGLNWSADIDEVDEAMRRDKIDRNAC
jgi:hypothetical protein